MIVRRSRIAEPAGSRGHCIAYDIRAAAKARGASPRKYAEGDARRANTNPHGGGGGRTAKMWPSTLDPAHIAANAKAMKDNKPAPFTYARGMYQLDPSDKRPRNVRRQSYRIDAAAVAA